MTDKSVTDKKKKPAVKKSKAKPLAAPSFSIATIPQGKLDQALPLPELPDFLMEVENTVGLAVAEGKPEIAFNLVISLTKAGQLVGVGLAKSFWMIRENWGILGEGLDDFESEMFRRFAKASDTIRRYVGVWDMMQEMDEYIPKEQQTALLERPMVELIAISQHIREHGRLTVKQVGKLAAGGDLLETRKMLASISNREVDADVININLKEDGTLEAWRDGEVTTVGFLRIKGKDLTDEVRRKAISRIMHKSGISSDKDIFAEKEEAV